MPTDPPPVSYDKLRVGPLEVTRVNAEVESCGLSVTGSTSPNQVGAVRPF